MYHIYQTRAFILKTVPHKEAGLAIDVLTRDLGRVWANAQGARKIESKLRPHIQEYALCDMALVLGKGRWRLVDARAAAPHGHPYDRARLKTKSRICSLLRRLVSGEEKDPKLFAIVEAAMHFLEMHTVSEKTLPDLEAVVVLRILARLGYVGESAELDSFVVSPAMTFDLLEHAGRVRSSAIRTINRSLRETQL